jgi:hypothetical protein
MKVTLRITVEEHGGIRREPVSVDAGQVGIFGPVCQRGDLLETPRIDGCGVLRVTGRRFRGPIGDPEECIVECDAHRLPGVRP